MGAKIYCRARWRILFIIDNSTQGIQLVLLHSLSAEMDVF